MAGCFYQFSLRMEWKDHKSQNYLLKLNWETNSTFEGIDARLNNGEDHFKFFFFNKNKQKKTKTFSLQSLMIWLALFLELLSPVLAIKVTFPIIIVVIIIITIFINNVIITIIDILIPVLHLWHCKQHHLPRVEKVNMKNVIDKLIKLAATKFLEIATNFDCPLSRPPVDSAEDPPSGLGDKVSLSTPLWVIINMWHHSDIRLTPFFHNHQNISIYYH